MKRKYLLDTNVVSEVRKREPNAGVQVFLRGPEVARTYLSVLTIGELRKGVAAKRRTDAVTADRIALWVNETERQYAQRLLPVDVAVASPWGELTAGRNLPVVDSLLAATAIVHGLILVTRNTRDFEPSGVPTLDPWQAE